LEVRSVIPASETLQSMWKERLGMSITYLMELVVQVFSSLQGKSLQQQVDESRYLIIYILWAFKPMISSQ